MEKMDRSEIREAKEVGEREGEGRERGRGKQTLR